MSKSFDYREVCITTSSNGAAPRIALSVDDKGICNYLSVPCLYRAHREDPCVLSAVLITLIETIASELDDVPKDTGTYGDYIRNLKLPNGVKPAITDTKRHS